MWIVDNHTPFASASGFMRDHQARTFWCVWLKASFDLRDGKPAFYAPAQSDPMPGAQYVKENGVDVMIADADLCLPKPQIDVIANARAYAPNGRYDRPFEAALGLGPIQKRIEISPPGSFARGGKPQYSNDKAVQDAPVSLSYANAYGGQAKDQNGALALLEDNPIGAGFVPQKGDPEGIALPRLSLPGQAIQRADRAIAPISFGPIPREWAKRRKLGGTYDQAWERARSPLFPTDLDPNFWQAAPLDQRIEPREIAGATLSLSNMLPPEHHSGRAPFQCALPRLDFELSTRFRGRWTESDMRLQTIHIDGYAARLSMTYLGALPIEAVQNDVLVERSFLALRDHAGFTVRAADAPAFEAARSSEAPDAPLPLEIEGAS
ncbi:MAG: hypothetical protein ACJA06_000927 [Halocynthiibacter sp.]|jgi:hypothetical protein